MHYILTGFIHDTGFRVFTFVRIETHAERLEYSVRVDLDLTRKYHIAMQELPMLCRNFLERCDELGGERALTFTKEAMQRVADDRANAQKTQSQKRTARRVPTHNLGAAWRGHTSLPPTPAPEPAASATGQASEAAAGPATRPV